MWTVLYHETSLHLNDDQYLELTRLAFDDPPAALEMADRLLAEGSE